MSESYKNLALAKHFLDTQDFFKACELLKRELIRDPNDPITLYLQARAFLDDDKPELGLPFAQKATQLDGEHYEHWLCLAACEAMMERPEQSEAAARKADSLRPDNIAIMSVLANASLGKRDYDQCWSYADKILAQDPENQSAHVAKAYVHFNKREWGEGWDEFRYGAGWQKWRDKHDYGLPEWDNEGTCIVYAEQGLGDQIAYCSTIPDVPQCIQLNVAPKLENLFQRTFPDIEVFGEQFAEPVTFPIKADYSVSMTGIQRFHRRKPEDYPKTPYLIPHPEKVEQWSALVDPMRPTIGIAWTGGEVGSPGWINRNIELEDLLPLLKQDYQFVNLEYRDKSGEVEDFCKRHNVTINSWNWGTETNDYDDTAALVSCLDAVVCVPTTCYHLAGGLGVPAYVIVHDQPHHHEQGSNSPWWGSVTFFKREELGLEGCVEKVVECLASM